MSHDSQQSHDSHIRSHDSHMMCHCSHIRSHGSHKGPMQLHEVTCSHMTHKDIKCVFTVHKLLVEKRVLDHVDSFPFLYLYGVEEAMSEHGAR